MKEGSPAPARWSTSTTVMAAKVSGTARPKTNKAVTSTAASQRATGATRLGVPAAASAAAVPAAATVSNAASSANAALSIFPSARLASTRRSSSCFACEKSTVVAEPLSRGSGTAEPVTAATIHDFAPAKGSSRTAASKSSGLHARR